MKLLVVLSAVLVAITASSVQFAAVPSTIKLPATSASLSSSSLAQLNANLLGLSTESVEGFDVETDLFSRPRALAVVQVDGVDSVGNNEKYNLVNNGLSLVSLDEKLAIIFGADRETVTTKQQGITGSALAQKAMEQKVSGDAIKTKLAPLRDELLQVYRLAAAITSQGAKFDESASADIYNINILSLAGQQLSDEDKATAMTDIQNAIQKLTSALSSVYGEQILVEVVSISNPIDSSVEAQSAPGDSTDGHHIKKREEPAGKNETVDISANEQERIMNARKGMNVNVFTSSDYPAIFAIFAGLSIVLALAVLYVTVGMMTMDPGKDSIIYRMTTTRMKKD